MPFNPWHYKERQGYACSHQPEGGFWEIRLHRVYEKEEPIKRNIYWKSGQVRRFSVDGWFNDRYHKHHDYYNHSDNVRCFEYWTRTSHGVYAYQYKHGKR